MVPYSPDSGLHFWPVFGGISSHASLVWLLLPLASLMPPSCCFPAAHGVCYAPSHALSEFLASSFVCSGSLIPFLLLFLFFSCSVLFLFFLLFNIIFGCFVLVFRVLYGLLQSFMDLFQSLLGLVVLL